MDWQALWLSFKLAGMTSLVLLVLGVPLAAWLAFSPSRWWKALVETVVALPVVLPPAVLGFYVLLALGPRSPLGQAWEGLMGRSLPFSFEGLLVASVLYSLPFAVQPFVGAFLGVDRRLLEASWTLGVGRLGTFFRIVLPLSKTGVLSGVLLSFAHTVGEFGVVLMVGGNLPGQTRTAAIAIYDDVQALDYASANQTALVLVGFSFVMLFLLSLLKRRSTLVWPGGS